MTDIATTKDTKTVQKDFTVDKADIATQMKAPAAEHDPEKFEHKTFIDYKEQANKIGIVALGKPKGFQSNTLDPDHTVGVLANSFMLQLFDVSALAPGQMRDKVLGYQDEVMTILTHYLREAMRCERTRMGLILEAAGHSSAAALVRPYKIALPNSKE